MKFDKFNEVNSKHPKNILPIPSTFDVSKLDKFNEVNLKHLSNIPPILSTFDVLKLDKSNEVNFEQLPNIFSIFVTSDVIKADIFPAEITAVTSEAAVIIIDDNYRINQLSLIIKNNIFCYQLF